MCLHPPPSGIGAHSGREPANTQPESRMTTSPTDPYPAKRWLLQLEGEDEELQALVKMFPPGPSALVSVHSIDGSYYLYAMEFEEMDSHKMVWARGRILSERLTGLGRLKFGSFRRVRPASVIQPLADHKNKTVVVEPWRNLPGD